MMGDPEIIRLADGNLAVTWDQGALTGEVVGAVINPATGFPVHSQFTVSIYSDDGDPEATALSNGNWVVAMTSDRDI